MSQPLHRASALMTLCLSLFSATSLVAMTGTAPLRVTMRDGSPVPTPFSAGPGNDYFRSDVPLALSESQEENLYDLIVDGNPRPAPRPDPKIPGVLTYVYDEPSKTWREPVFNIRLTL